MASERCERKSAFGWHEISPPREQGGGQDSARGWLDGRQRPEAKGQQDD